MVTKSKRVDPFLSFPNSLNTRSSNTRRLACLWWLNDDGCIGYWRTNKRWKQIHKTFNGIASFFISLNSKLYKLKETPFFFSTGHFNTYSFFHKNKRNDFISRTMYRIKFISSPTIIRTIIITVKINDSFQAGRTYATKIETK